MYQHQDDSRLINRTKGDGDCAFHATLGTWNLTNGRFEVDDIQEKRNLVADAIRACRPDSTLFPLVKTAILALVMDNDRQVDFCQSLREDYKKYETENNSLIENKWAIFEQKIVSSSDNTITEYIDSFVDAYIKKKKVGEDTQSRLRSNFRDRVATCLNEDKGELLRKIGSSPTLKEKYIDYQRTTQNTGFDFSLSDDLLNGYADFIAQPTEWLLPCELAIIAYVFDISIEYYSVRTAAPEHFNAGNSPPVLVCFNGHNHYERMTDEKMTKVVSDHKTLSANVTETQQIQMNSFIRDICRHVLQQKHHDVEKEIIPILQILTTFMPKEIVENGPLKKESDGKLNIQFGEQSPWSISIDYSPVEAIQFVILYDDTKEFSLENVVNAFSQIAKLVRIDFRELIPEEIYSVLKSIKIKNLYLKYNFTQDSPRIVLYFEISLQSTSTYLLENLDIDEINLPFKISFYRDRTLVNSAVRFMAANTLFIAYLPSSLNKSWELKAENIIFNDFLSLLPEEKSPNFQEVIDYIESMNIVVDNFKAKIVPGKKVFSDISAVVKISKIEILDRKIWIEDFSLEINKDYNSVNFQLNATLHLLEKKATLCFHKAEAGLYCSAHFADPFMGSDIARIFNIQPNEKFNLIEVNELSIGLSEKVFHLKAGNGSSITVSYNTGDKQWNIEFDVLIAIGDALDFFDVKEPLLAPLLAVLPTEVQIQKQSSPHDLSLIRATKNMRDLSFPEEINALIPDFLEQKVVVVLSKRGSEKAQFLLEQPSLNSIISRLPLTNTNAVEIDLIQSPRKFKIKGDLDLIIFSIKNVSLYIAGNMVSLHAESHINETFLGIQFKNLRPRAEGAISALKISANMDFEVGRKTGLPQNVGGTAVFSFSTAIPAPALTAKFDPSAQLGLGTLISAFVPLAEQSSSGFTSIINTLETLPLHCGAIIDTEFQACISIYNKRNKTNIDTALCCHIQSATNVTISGELNILNLLHAFLVLRISAMDGIQLLASMKEVNVFNGLVRIKKSQSKLGTSMDYLGLSGPTIYAQFPGVSDIIKVSRSGDIGNFLNKFCLSISAHLFFLGIHTDVLLDISSDGLKASLKAGLSLPIVTLGAGIELQIQKDFFSFKFVTVMELKIPKCTVFGINIPEIRLFGVDVDVSVTYEEKAEFPFALKAHCNVVLVGLEFGLDVDLGLTKEECRDFPTMLINLAKGLAANAIKILGQLGLEILRKIGEFFVDIGEAIVAVCKTVYKAIESAVREVIAFFENIGREVVELFDSNAKAERKRQERIADQARKNAPIALMRFWLRRGEYKDIQQAFIYIAQQDGLFPKDGNDNKTTNKHDLTINVDVFLKKAIELMENNPTYSYGYFKFLEMYLTSSSYPTSNHAIKFQQLAIVRYFLAIFHLNDNVPMSEVFCHKIDQELDKKYNAGKRTFINKQSIHETGINLLIQAYQNFNDSLKDIFTDYQTVVSSNSTVQEYQESIRNLFYKYGIEVDFSKYNMEQECDVNALNVKLSQFKDDPEISPLFILYQLYKHKDDPVLLGIDGYYGYKIQGNKDSIDCLNGLYQMLDLDKLYLKAKSQLKKYPKLADGKLLSLDIPFWNYRAIEHLLVDYFFKDPKLLDRLAEDDPVTQYIKSVDIKTPILSALKYYYEYTLKSHVIKIKNSKELIAYLAIEINKKRSSLQEKRTPLESQELIDEINSLEQKLDNEKRVIHDNISQFEPGPEKEHYKNIVVKFNQISKNLISYQIVTAPPSDEELTAVTEGSAILFEIDQLRKSCHIHYLPDDFLLDRIKVEQEQDINTLLTLSKNVKTYVVSSLDQKTKDLLASIIEPLGYKLSPQAYTQDYDIYVDNYITQYVESLFMRLRGLVHKAFAEAVSTVQIRSLADNSNVHQIVQTENPEVKKAVISARFCFNKAIKDRILSREIEFYHHEEEASEPAIFSLRTKISSVDAHKDLGDIYQSDECRNYLHHDEKHQDTHPSSAVTTNIHCESCLNQSAEHYLKYLELFYSKKKEKLSFSIPYTSSNISTIYDGSKEVVFDLSEFNVDVNVSLEEFDKALKSYVQPKPRARPDERAETAKNFARFLFNFLYLSEKLLNEYQKIYSSNNPVLRFQAALCLLEAIQLSIICFRHGLVSGYLLLKKIGSCLDSNLAIPVTETQQVHDISDDSYMDILIGTRSFNALGPESKKRLLDRLKFDAARIANDGFIKSKLLIKENHYRIDTEILVSKIFMVAIISNNKSEKLIELYEILYKKYFDSSVEDKKEYCNWRERSGLFVGWSHTGDNQILKDRFSRVQHVIYEQKCLNQQNREKRNRHFDTLSPSTINEASSAGKNKNVEIAITSLSSTFFSQSAKNENPVRIIPTGSNGEITAEDIRKFLIDTCSDGNGNDNKRYNLILRHISSRYPKIDLKIPDLEEKSLHALLLKATDTTTAARKLLHLAALDCNFVLIEKIVELRQNINDLDSGGNGVIRYALNSKKIDDEIKRQFIENLLELGACFQDSDDQKQYNALCDELDERNAVIMSLS